MDLIVTEGEIRLNSILCVVDREDAKIFSVDANSKYAISYAAVGNVVTEVMLVADEDTLHTDESKKGKPTVLSFTHADAGWRVSVETGRYTTTIIFYREIPDTGVLVWDKED